MPRSTTSLPSRALHQALLTLSFLAAACGGQETSPGPSTPLHPVTDLVRSEAAAVRAAQDLAGLLAEPLARGQIEMAAEALVENGFRGTGFAPGAVDRAGAGGAAPLEIQWLVPASPSDTRTGFLEGLHALCPLDSEPMRLECELIGFELDEGGNRARGEVRLRWAGTTSQRRVDLMVQGLVELRFEAQLWKLAAFEPARREGHARGAGVRIRGPREPLFVDRTEAVGLTFGTSEANAELLQAFVDRHRTLTLGGLSVVDVNGDDLPDLIATRSEESTITFLNDGQSGFVPEPFPIPRYADRPAFMLWVDLDGDGLEEVVASEASLYEGAAAYAGLWTRTGADEGAWRHLPRAFPMPNPVGLRRLDVQTVAPLDVDGDGDLDLFFAVYGNANSRGDHYNTVEAYDGADNHLFVNGGELVFTEESEARGISGTGYTYVALAFDADRDGDPDLFEGNDFGPNVLWRNDGGHFTADESMGFGGVSAYTMGAALTDLDADGRMDLYISNMSSEEGMRMVPLATDLSAEMRERVNVIAHGNMLYTEPEEPGQPWPSRARELGIHEAEWAWGCQFVDVDGDGSQEILVTNGFASHRDAGLGDWQTYYWRQVIDDARQLEAGQPSKNVNGSVRFRGSFNGHERDRVFTRVDGTDPDRPWVDAGFCRGYDGSWDGRALVPMDGDGDGDLDLALWTLTGLRYLENVSEPDPGAWARLRVLASEGTGAGPALGAWVKVTDGGRVQARHVAIVEGFQSQVSTDLHFRLEPGSTGAIEEVEVTWPDGRNETSTNVPRGRIVTLTPGFSEAETGPLSAELPRWSESAANPAIQAGRAGSWPVSLALLARTPAAMGLPEAPLVVHVTSLDSPRPDPFKPFGPGAAALPDNVRVVRAFLRTGDPREKELPARDHLLLEPELYAAATGPSEEATVVYDSRGRTMRIFRGQANLGAIRAYCELAAEEAPFPHLLVEHGRQALDESRYRDALKLFQTALEGRDDLAAGDAQALEGLGRSYVLLDRMDLAEAAYARSVELDPDYALGHYNLGATYSQTGRFEEATKELLEARRIEGDTQRVLGALAEAAASAGRTELARESALAWLEQSPGDPSMLTLVGKIEARAGNLREAKDYFQRALSQKPGDSEAAEALRLTEKLLGER